MAALRLLGVDWRAGSLTVHGKGNNTEALPLPPDVGGSRGSARANRSAIRACTSTGPAAHASTCATSTSSVTKTTCR